MIIWGGMPGDQGPHLVDGAAFDPNINEWRMLPPSPISPERATRAVWAGNRMIVMSDEAIAAYSPDSNDWEFLAGRFVPALIPGTSVADAGFIYSWTPFGITQVDADTGTWQGLPDPGFGSDQHYQGALRVIDGSLYAIGLEDGDCQAGSSSNGPEPTGVALPRPLAAAEAADCPSPTQTAVAGGRLIIWDDVTRPTLAYDPEFGSWEEIARVPLLASEIPLGPVQMGGEILAPGPGEGALYDPSTDEWQKVFAEYANNPLEMVWTGEELLMGEVPAATTSPADSDSRPPGDGPRHQADSMESETPVGGSAAPCLHRFILG